MNAKRTLGPWRIDRHLGMIVGPDGAPITGEANFVLAAAAPELLDALIAVIAYGSMTGGEWVADKVNAAIAKATGEQA